MSADPWSLFDAGFYSSQVGRLFFSRKACYQHYLRQGQYESLDPHPLFATEWYVWQNPHWTRWAKDPFSEFLSHGSHRGADPSYLVDMVTFRRRVSPTLDPATALFTEGGFVTEGVYPDLTVLDELQTHFLSAISPILLQAPADRTYRPYLVHLQTGSPDAVDAIDSSLRRYDILANFYSPQGLDVPIGEYRIFQIGTKFTAASLISSQFPWLYPRYRYVLFLDDDIDASVEQINSLFDICERAGLWLGQASLTQDSHCVWPALFQRLGGPSVRYLNAAEIMMPVLSAKALELCSPHFRESISGFGLDLLFGKLISSKRKAAVGVVDAVALRHSRAIDSKGGSFYEFMRSNHINPKAELWNLVTKYNLDREIREV